MRIPTPDDFHALTDWGLVERPCAALDDYSPEREQRRTENDRHRRAREEQIENASPAFVDDRQSYYREMERPIHRTKWAYLKRRKAWFQPPVGWGRFAAPGTSRLLDLGCGDGDQTQRVADFVAGRWRSAGYDGFPLEIIGVDLSDSRVENARRHTRSPHERITLRFETGDALAGLDYGDAFFDHSLAMGLFEVLDDDEHETVLDELTRLTTHSVYIRDILDEYPGLTPRPALDDDLAARGFAVDERGRLFEEPFVESGSRDPLAVWPMNVHQVVVATATDPPAHETRY
jgi:SAM-dependent methyltransferase